MDTEQLRLREKLRAFRSGNFDRYQQLQETRAMAPLAVSVDQLASSIGFNSQNLQPVQSYQRPSPNKFQEAAMSAPYQHLSFGQDSWNPIRGNRFAGMPLDVRQVMRGAYRADSQANMRPCVMPNGRNHYSAHTNAPSPDSGYLSQPLDALSVESAPIATRSEASSGQRPSKRRRTSQRSSIPVGLLGVCPVCKREGRDDFPFINDSDKRKHMKTHEKPFKCYDDDCKGDPYGCATDNDLWRHKETVHGIYRPTSVFYKCCVPACPKAAEIHRRKDNFRDHIKRMHVQSTKTKTETHIRDDDVEYWVSRSVYKPTPAEVQGLRDGKTSSSRRRRPQASASGVGQANASDVGSTIYDGSSVGQGQGYESEYYAAPQEQALQWMGPSYEPNYADDTLDGFDFTTGLDRNLDGMGLLADPSLSDSGLALDTAPSDASQAFTREPTSFQEFWDATAPWFFARLEEEVKSEPDMQSGPLFGS